VVVVNYGVEVLYHRTNSTENPRNTTYTSYLGYLNMVILGTFKVPGSNTKVYYTILTNQGPLP